MFAHFDSLATVSCGLRAGGMGLAETQIARKRSELILHKDCLNLLCLAGPPGGDQKRCHRPRQIDGQFRVTRQRARTFGARAMRVAQLVPQRSERLDDLLAAAQELLEGLLRVVIWRQLQHFGAFSVEHRKVVGVFDFDIGLSDIGPNRLTHFLTISWQRSTPRSNARSSTLPSDSGKRTYSITTSWITSGERSNQRNGSCALDFRAIPPV